MARGRVLLELYEEQKACKIKPVIDQTDYRLFHRSILWNEELRVDYYEGTVVKGKTCKDHYKELYPKLSDRTMERDFLVLSRVGFPVRYNRSLRYYEFFEEDTDWPWVGGVFYDKKAKKLKRIVSEDTDCPKQELHMDEILDIREGLNRD